jgi:hypothetical protein
MVGTLRFAHPTNTPIDKPPQSRGAIASESMRATLKERRGRRECRVFSCTRRWGNGPGAFQASRARYGAI